MCAVELFYTLEATILKFPFLRYIGVRPRREKRVQDRLYAHAQNAGIPPALSKKGGETMYWRTFGSLRRPSGHLLIVT